MSTAMPKKPSRAAIDQGYHEPRLCEGCKHMESRERACGSQSFYTQRHCTKGMFLVSKHGTCHEWKAR